MNFNPNGLFYKMFDIYKNHKRNDNKIIICNELQAYPVEIFIKKLIISTNVVRKT